MTDVDRKNADYLRMLEAQGATLTDEEAALAYRFQAPRLPARPPWRFPWLASLLGAALWVIVILAIFGAVWVIGA